MRILTEDLHSIPLNSEQFGDVLIAVQAVGDKKWDNDDIDRSRQPVPVRDQWRFFHVGIADTGEFAAGADSLRLAFGCDRAVVVQLGSVRNDEKRGLRWLYIGCNFVGAGQQQFRYDRIVANRFAVDPGLAVCASRNRPIQFQLSRNYCLCEITFADKIRHHENLRNFLVREKKPRVAQTWFFLPKSAAYIREEISFLNFAGMPSCWRARIGIHSRSVTDDQ